MVNKMRKVTIICIVILLILLLSPILTSVITNQNETTINIVEKEILERTIELCDENFCDEAIKAVLAINENNYTLKNNNFNFNIKRSNYSDEYFSRVKTLYNELEICIEFNREKVFIPTATLSNGNTKEDKKYEYMKTVASPWDTFSENFVYKKDYPCGVSIEGINYLCSEGMNHKDALKWYLPLFDIK